MNALATVAVAAIAALHLYILALEMFLWETRGLAVFRLSPEFARASKALAANQGLYNGFLAVGLLWGLWLGAAGREIVIFFLLCVIVAGLFGASTVARKIFFVQTAPALIALALTILS